MQNLQKTLKREIFPISLILILAFARLIPHPPNFTPIIAVAIMSSYFFRNTLLSCAVIIISMLLADIFIGFYKNIFFVYLSLLLIIYIFSHINRKIKLKNLFIFGLLGSIIFFILSNFGVWILSEMYEKNLNGLIQCYLMAIPFFKNTLFSSVIFTYISYMTSYYFKFSLNFR